MTIFQSIILGIVQGLTEFLPISSSGHLVIVPKLLGWKIPPQDAFIFDVLVQVATLAAVLAYFWKVLTAIGTAFVDGLKQRDPWSDPQSRLGWYLILATIPAGLFGLLFKDQIEGVFNSLAATGLFLLLTALILFVAERVGKCECNLDKMTWKKALLVGLAQVLALFPGVSRSGSTITGGMLANLQRQAAARFSFLMSIPIMVAAGLLASLDLFALPNFASLLPVFIPGFITAAVVGYLSIRWLLGFLTRYPLYVFSIYCTVIGLVTLLFSLNGGG